MRKIYMMLTALLASFAITANAGIKELYSWTSLAESDWARHGNVGVTVTSDTEGSYYTLTNGGGGARSAVTFWGDVISDYTKYTMELSFNITSYANTDAGRYLGAQFCFLSTDVDATTFKADKNTQQTDGYVLDFMQKFGNNGVAPDWSVNTFFVNGDSVGNTANIAYLPIGGWYKLTVEVDGNSITYQVKEDGNPDAAPVVNGTTTVPKGVTNKIGGLYLRLARSQGALSLSNLKISTEVEGAVANKPTVTLADVWQNERTYSIDFTGEDEILHYIVPGEEEQQIDYWTANPDGNPKATVNVTAKQSGTLMAWTEVPGNQSDKVSTDVDATAITLVEPTYIINEVENGYGKVYRLSIDNSQVLLSPQIFLSATFTPDGEGTAFTDLNVNNGGTFKVDGKGTIVVKANTMLINDGEHAGTRAYNESSITIVNDKSYKKNEAKSINFAHMTAEQLQAAGFTADGNAGGNFASYGRLYGIDETTVEAETPTKIVYNEIPQFTKKSSAFENGTMFNGLYCIGNAEDGTTSATPQVNVHVWQGVGLNLEGRKGDAADGSWINYAYFKIEGLTENDYTATYSCGNYGNGGDKDSNHPAVKDLATLATMVQTTYNLIENTCTIRQGTAAIPLYRVSDAIGRIDVYSPENPDPTGIEAVKTVVPAMSADAPIYNLSGVRVANANQKGIYIQNGKKFVVK